MTKNKSMTAKEFMAQLSEDREHIKLTVDSKRERATNELEYQKAVAPVLEELSKLGINTDLYELPERHGPLSAPVTEVLLTWLPRISNLRVLEGLIRALGAPTECYDGTSLTVLFEKPDNVSLRWTIANTIAEARPYNITDWVVKSVRTDSYGKDREMLIVALARMADVNTAQSTLMPLIDEFPGFVAMAFAECGDDDAIELLKSKKVAAKQWERQEIDKAIRTLK